MTAQALWRRWRAWLRLRTYRRRLWRHGPILRRPTYRFTTADERIREGAQALRERADNIRRDSARATPPARRGLVAFRRHR